MNSIELLGGGKIRLMSGRVVGLAPNYLHAEVFADHYEVSSRDSHGRISVVSRDGSSGAIRWQLLRAENSVAGVEDSGFSLKTPQGVVRFPRPIVSVLEIASRYVVVLKMLGNDLNPVLCFDSSGHELWNCAGYFHDLAPGDGKTYVTGFQGDSTFRIDLATGAKSHGVMAK